MEVCGWGHTYTSDRRPRQGAWMIRHSPTATATTTATGTATGDMIVTVVVVVTTMGSIVDKAICCGSLLGAHELCHDSID